MAIGERIRFFRKLTRNDTKISGTDGWLSGKDLPTSVWRSMKSGSRSPKAELTENLAGGAGSVAAGAVRAGH